MTESLMTFCYIYSVLE